MPGSRRLIVVGVVTLLLGLIVLFPARVASQWFAPPGVAVSGITGTLWTGSAQSVVVNGVYLSDLSWRMKPLRLFTGQLAYAVSGSPSFGTFDADIAIGVGGDILLTGLDSRFSLSTAVIVSASICLTVLPNVNIRE